jgi:glycosyltransferase involved in cell wall biosynthesis
LLGHQPFAVLKDHVQKAKAFVYAAEEDFGIAMVEAQACGTPVIAFGRGGSLETIVGLQNTDAGGQRTDKEPTGVFFYEQTTEALKNAIRDFEKNQEKFDGQQIREHVIRFSVERFKREFKEFVDRKTAGML